MRFVVGPPWLPVTVAVDGGLVRRLKPFFETAGGVTGAESDGPALTVFAAEEVAGRGPGRFELDGDVYRGDAPEGEGRYYLTESRGEVVLTPRSGAYFETFLRQVFLLESYRRGGLALHSVAFGRNDEAIISCGASDSGKSTLARMLGERFTVYSDEMNVVADGRVWALPFRGTGVERVNGGGGKLRALAFHRPGRRFAAAPLEAADAARALCPNVFLPEGAGAELSALAFERVADLAQHASSFAATVSLEVEITREGFSKILDDAF